jgi:hypothetical protein
LYGGDKSDHPSAAVIATNGFAGIKEHVELYAESFYEAGLAVLLYDHRNTGDSDGEPRQDIDGARQIRDMRQAITYLESQPGVRSDAIGLWGCSFSGGHVLAVAGIDRRVRCVVSQVPLISGLENFAHGKTPAAWSQYRQWLDDNRTRDFAGGPPATTPIASAEADDGGAFPGAKRAYYYLVASDLGKQHNAKWVNACTVRSLDVVLEYDVAPFLKHISPTPLLMIVSPTDVTTPGSIALAAYESALEPKELVMIEGDHYSGYFPDEEFALTSSTARKFFVEHLINERE